MMNNNEIMEIVKLGAITLVLFLIGLCTVGSFNGAMAVVFIGFGLSPVGLIRSCLGVRWFIFPSWTSLFVGIIIFVVWLCIVVYVGAIMFAFYWIRATFRLVSSIIARKKASNYN